MAMKFFAEGHDANGELWFMDGDVHVDVIDKINAMISEHMIKGNSNLEMINPDVEPTGPFHVYDFEMFEDVSDDLN
jgi:hypothetical protein